LYVSGDIEMALIWSYERIDMGIEGRSLREKTSTSLVGTCIHSGIHDKEYVATITCMCVSCGLGLTIGEARSCFSHVNRFGK
jgi:hypothetical protein